jgi:hypothetical protein
MPFLDNPVVLAVLAGLVVLVFFVYLMLRRTVLGFREGFEQGRN